VDLQSRCLLKELVILEEPGDEESQGVEAELPVFYFPTTPGFFAALRMTSSFGGQDYRSRGCPIVSMLEARMAWPFTLSLSKGSNLCK
jgi:hypothetical protein